METQTESTMSTESREDSNDAQSMLDWYESEKLNIAIEWPYASMTDVMEMLMRGSPCTSRKNLVHLFGGPGLFKQTYRRMEVIRWATIKNKLALLPLGRGGQAGGAEGGAGQRNYQNDNYIRRWAPILGRVNSFPWELPLLGGRLTRYPAEADSAECFTTDEESQQSDTEGNNGDNVMDLQEEVYKIKKKRTKISQRGQTRGQ